MVAETIFGSIAAIGAVASAIFGGGILNRYIKGSNEMAVTKYVLDETKHKLECVVADVATLKSSSVELKTKMDRFEDSLKKLDLLPTLSAKLSTMETMVDSMFKLLTQDRDEYTND